jgi:hypothetical protein
MADLHDELSSLINRFGTEAVANELLKHNPAAKVDKFVTGSRHEWWRDPKAAIHTLLEKHSSRSVLLNLSEAAQENAEAIWPKGKADEHHPARTWSDLAGRVGHVAAIHTARRAAECGGCNPEPAYVEEQAAALNLGA